MKNKWDDIFDEPRGKRSWSICVFVSIALIMVIIFLEILFPECFSDETIKIVFDTLIAIITGVISAAILNIFYKVYESQKLNQIKSISYDGLLVDFFQVLSELDGKYRKDEHIELEFLKYKNSSEDVVEDFYTIKINYEFKTKLRNPYFQCLFSRVYADTVSDNNIGKYTSGMYARLKKYEFYWMNDETQFINKALVNDDSYKIYDAFIDSHAITDIKVDKLNTSDGKELEYTFSFPRDVHIDLKKEHTIRFTVIMPMERESILFLTHEYPAKDTEVTIKNSAVANQMELYIIPVTGAIQVQKQISMEEGKEFYSYSGWMLPKSGYIVSWWDLNESPQNIKEGG